MTRCRLPLLKSRKVLLDWMFASSQARSRLTDEGGDPITQLANLSSFAEKMLCPERSLVKIRNDMPLDRASLIGCGVTTGLGAALNTVNIPAGASVVIPFEDLAFTDTASFGAFVRVGF